MGVECVDKWDKWVEVEMGINGINGEVERVDKWDKWGSGMNKWINGWING